MDKYSYYYIFKIMILLIFFAATGESGRSGKKKTAVATTSASLAGGVSSEIKNKLVRECFADFLVIQIEENARMHGDSDKQFVLLVNPLLANREKIRVFMQKNVEKTAKLWNCVNKARPFPHNTNGVSGGRNSSEMLADLIDIFRMEITTLNSIAPSKNVQEKLHNAQCLLDLGVIEGKIRMKRPRKNANYEPSGEAEWIEKLLKKQSDKQLQIVVGKEESIYLDKCLHKSKRFAKAKLLAKEQQKPNEYLFPLESIKHREELEKFYKLVSISKWLLEKIGLNMKQKQCFADLFILQFEIRAKISDNQEFVVRENEFLSRTNSVSGSVYSDQSDDEYSLVEGSDFPQRGPVSGLMNENTKEARKKQQPFVDCLKGASPFPNHLSNPKHVNNLVQEFYDQVTPLQEIPLTQKMQQKMRKIFEKISKAKIITFTDNAQCWLDLGALEGKLNMAHIQPRIHYEKLADDDERRMPWLVHLKNHQQPIVISPEGAAHMGRCLRKGSPFDAKFEKTAEKQQWNLQLLYATENERNDLLKVIKQTPSSEWLRKEIFYEQNCVAEWLVRNWHAQTKMLSFYTDPTMRVPQELWRKIEWNNYVKRQNGDHVKVHEKDNAKGFDELKSCLFRKTALLKLETPQSKQNFIDLEILFQLMGGSIYLAPLLTQEINIQSDCLAKFLVIKHRRTCLFKKRRGPAGEGLYNHDHADPLYPYIIESDDGAGQFMLSAENCRLPEKESGIYIEKENEEFDKLWECGIRMITEHERKKAIDVRELLKIHTREQRFLRGIPMEILPTAKPMPGDKCSSCGKEYDGENDRIVLLPCQHKFHDHCLQSEIIATHGRVRNHCPICKGSLLLNVLEDPGLSDDAYFTQKLLMQLNSRRQEMTTTTHDGGTDYAEESDDD